MTAQELAAKRKRDAERAERFIATPPCKAWRASSRTGKPRRRVFGVYRKG